MKFTTISVFLSIIFTISGCSPKRAEVALDYSKIQMLDAENLAETGIVEAYKNLEPELRIHISSTAEIQELIDPNAPSYSVRALGSEYIIYSPSTTTGEYESWGLATYALFKIVNDQLANSNVRFYALNSGNDLSGIFLTQQQAEAAKASIPKRSDWPYLPSDQGPWYGQYH